MSDYLTTKEVAIKWNISTVRVTTLCADGRVEGAKKDGHKWLIPITAEKPEDKRLKEEKYHFKYVDLFAGIGGFHQAMRFLGGQCVMACEINQACVETYLANFHLAKKRMKGDIRTIDPNDIEPFDVLCAGFPCQPFSKAGLQKGFEDKERGNLFYTILDFLDCHDEVEFVILENVRNLADKTENWDIIRTELSKRDFVITKEPLILSPSDFGLPQIRERVYILGIKRSRCSECIRNKGYIEEEDLNLDKYYKKCKMGDALKILEEEVPNDYCIEAEEQLMLNAWEEFRLATKIGIIGFPIWIDYFGLGIEEESEFYRRVQYSVMPKWKQDYVDKNRQLYLKHRAFIDVWVDKYDMTNRIKLYKKFEWNCGVDIKAMQEGIIQIRQSGIRVKRPTFFPSLVAIVNTPIIWDVNKQAYRHITPREAANLQNYHGSFKLIGTDQQIYKQLGNSVNVRVIKILADNLFKLRHS